jgi:hypothetical protein
MKLRPGRCIDSSQVYKSRCPTPKQMAMSLEQSLAKSLKQKERPTQNRNYQAPLEYSPILEAAKLQENQETLRMVERKKNIEEIKKLMKEKKERRKG